LWTREREKHNRGEGRKEIRKGFNTKKKKRTIASLKTI